MKISKIILYNEPSVPKINIKRVKEFLSNIFDIEVCIKENIFQNLNEKIYEEIASTRIFDLKKPFEKHIPSIKEISIELENKDMSGRQEMILYDGIELNKIVKDTIPIAENTLSILHIIFTNKLTCTFDENDFRYHARAWVGSNPIIISTTGIIEAPAKPKQFYMDLMTNFSEEAVEEIKKKYKGEFLEYKDVKLSEVVEGYILQILLCTFLLFSLLIL